jgi:HEAT repeat protein
MPAARLRTLLKSAHLVVAGQVTAVTSYDDDRVAVVQFAVERTLKGAAPNATSRNIALVEVRDARGRTELAAGMCGIAFLRPAARTSSLAQFLPAGTYFEVLPEFGAFVSAASKADAERHIEIVARIVAASRGGGMDANAARQLTFDLLASENPLLVEDAAGGITGLGHEAALTHSELETLRAALLRAALPDRVRVALIEAVAKAGLHEAVPALQSIDSPPAVAEKAWQALDQLGAPPPEQSMEARLADRDAAVRSAAVRELLRREGVGAVTEVAPIAIQDPDPAVRRAAVDALGALGKPEVLPPLERVFVDSPTELQQATGRAILAVGGPPAIDAFGRLAFAGPVPSQRYAVVLLMTMTDPHRDEVLERIAQTHSNADIRDLIAHGLPYHHH